MQKAILIALLAVVSSNAVAGWVQIETTDFATLYSDPTTIRKAGNRVKMWSLLDLDTGGSIKTQSEFDCMEGQSRTLAIVAYDGEMGGGSPVRRIIVTGKWEPASPESVADAKMKFACRKR